MRQRVVATCDLGLQHLLEQRDPPRWQADLPALEARKERTVQPSALIGALQLFCARELLDGLVQVPCGHETQLATR